MSGDTLPLQIGAVVMNVSVRRTNRTRTVGIRVHADASITVSAPRRLSIEQVNELVARRSGWIARQVDRMRALPPAGARRFNTGETVPFLGRELVIELTEQADLKPLAIRSGACLCLTAPAGVQAAIRRAAVVSFYVREALPFLTARVAHFSRLLAVAVPAIRIRDQQRRWGSCDPRGSLYLNWRLMMMPPDLLDYVIAHEVCHLRRADHSPQFWALVGQLIPDLEMRKKRLRDQGEQFTL